MAKFSEIIAIIIGIIVLISGIMKLIRIDIITNSFAEFNITGLLLTIGIIEIVSATLFIFRKTAVIGTLFLTAFFGGAILIHLTNNQLNIIPVPIIFLFLIWLTAHFRKKPSLI